MDRSFTIHLPDWIDAFLEKLPNIFASPADRMQLAIDLAIENIRRGSGGPFGAAIFEIESGILVSVGVNIVVPGNCSLAHAETTAIALAQSVLQTYDLSLKGRFELATSCAPCAMCLGAIGWSGLKSVLCGASEADARAIGFDEGAKPANWQNEFKKRGITVAENILQEQTRKVFEEYIHSGGKIYNPSQHPSQ
jgi:tRNA(Arg) A34 adenosine deaminase TadA